MNRNDFIANDANSIGKTFKSIYIQIYRVYTYIQSFQMSGNVKVTKVESETSKCA